MGRARTAVLPLIILLMSTTSPSDGHAMGNGDGGRASAGHTPQGKQHNNALFLRHIPQVSSDYLEASLSSSHHHHHHHHHHQPHHPHQRSTAAARHSFGGHHHDDDDRLDTEDIKIKPLHGKAALIGATKAWFRRAMDAVWLPGGTGAGTSTSPRMHTAGGPSGYTTHSSPQPNPYMRWRATTQDMLGLSGSGGGGANGRGGTRYYKPPPMHYANHPHQGLKVGPLLLAAHQNLGDVVHGGGGKDDGKKGGEGSSSSALDKISINMAQAPSEIGRECPVELIAPCAVPSASLKEQGAMREEGLVVPTSFLVGDVVDFISKMSRLERYSGGAAAAGSSLDRTASRSLERIFVTDCGRLVGYVTSMDLLVQDRAAPLSSIVRGCEVVVKESDEYDDAILAMRAKRLTYAPVVTNDNVVVGIITPADMLNEMEMEATDDVSRFSGSGSTESYFGTPILQLVTARAWWLISLLMLQSLSSIILTHFSALIERHLVIALFLTMCTGTAGNAGNQSSAMVIRGLATGEINRKNGWKVVMREVKAALLMSVLLAGAAFIRVYITPGSTFVCTCAVTLALSVTVVGACFLGTFAPLVLDRYVTLFVLLVIHSSLCPPLHPPTPCLSAHSLTLFPNLSTEWVLIRVIVRARRWPP